jgi:hypothetical protein
MSPDHCMVIGSNQVRAYHLTGNEGWSSYRTIVGAFEQRNRTRTEAGSSKGSKTSVLPPELVEAEVKLVVRDQDDPIECAVVWERIYPRRAWVGKLHPHLPTDMAFVVAGILNSAIGRVLYRRLARARKHTSHNLRKNTLYELRVPLLAYDQETFSRAALLSYRLHCLYAANQECVLPAEVLDVDVPNHWLRLLSELVRLYGYSEPEARRLVEEVLPEGLQDVPGVQGQLYYVPKEPLQNVKLLDRAALDRYEELKGHARSKTLTTDGRKELDNLQAMIQWEDRINGGIPHSLRPRPWPGISSDRDAIKAAYRYLSCRKGQAFGAENPRQVDQRIWEVSVFYSPPRGLKPEDMLTLPREWATPGKHSAGKLWVDVVTGEVRETLEAAQDAITAPKTEAALLALTD